jgi:ribosomal protein S27E
MSEIKCPKCGSTQITAEKQGFSGKKAAAGAILTGGIGLLAGTLGSDKIIVTCLNCGNNWKAGETNERKVIEKKIEPTKGTLKFARIAFIIMGIFCCLLVLVGILSKLTVVTIGFGLGALFCFFLAYGYSKKIKELSN